MNKDAVLVLVYAISLLRQIEAPQCRATIAQWNKKCKRWISPKKHNVDALRYRKVASTVSMNENAILETLGG
jgi:hypothetical protein